MKSQSKFKICIRNTGNSRKGKKLFKRKKQTCILFLTGNDKIISKETEKTGIQQIRVFACKETSIM